MINRGAFFNTSGIDSLVIPKHVTYVGDSAFINVSYDLYVFEYARVSQWAKNWTNKTLNYYSE